jgi:Na+/proline symporter
MTPTLALTILLVYFGILIVISFITSKGADTNTFFTANKQSPWYLVAFAMIGTSLSGVTFISVPGLVGSDFFAYFQLVLGYLVGYSFIALVLLPLYYRLNLISIYTYLEKRFGFWSYKTGSAFFLLSRTLGSALRLYIASKVLQIAIYDPLGVPFEVSVLLTIGLIWLYTFKGGIKTIIITDTLQTTFLVLAVVMTIYLISNKLGFSVGDLVSTLGDSKYSEIFFWDDFWGDKKHFFKQFISGAFLALVMTGLDQDLMQKNLTCKSLKDAQKNMFSFMTTYTFINLIFLSLGALLYIYAFKMGILQESGSLALPLNIFDSETQQMVASRRDDLYPMLAIKHFGLDGSLAGTLVAVTFLIGITAATYASSDSALTALTTSFCIDFMNVEGKTETERSRIKHWVHIGFSLLFYIIIIIFNQINSQEVINAVFKIASYTYSPLLGLFAFGLYTNRQVIDKWVPILCVVIPAIMYYAITYFSDQTGYKFASENLILNGLAIFIGLWLISRNRKADVAKH